MKTLLKAVYKRVPFKKELYSTLKAVWKPKEQIYRHLHFVGAFHVKVSASKSFRIKHYGYQVENEIFWAGLTNGWEKESIKLWIKLCEKSQTIFDIGANTGVYSLIAKAVNPNAKVYAFEPVARVFKKLEENIALNAFDIIPIERAVSDADGTAVIYDTPSEHTYSVTVNKNFLPPEIAAQEVEIKTQKLDTFVKQNNIEGIDLIKIDVESHEPEVLEGFLEHLFRFKPTLLIEILSDEVGQRVEAIVQKAGYLYFNIDENGGVRQVDTIGKSDYFNYLLCRADVAKELALIKSV